MWNMSSSSSVYSQNIEERDAIELYFAFFTAYSLDDKGGWMYDKMCWSSSQEWEWVIVIKNIHNRLKFIIGIYF